MDVTNRSNGINNADDAYRKFTSTAIARCSVSGPVLKTEIAALMQCPRDVTHVVDVGCGSGRLFGTLCSVFPLANITAFERDPFMYAEALVACRTKSVNVRVVKADYLSKKVCVDSADVVVTLGFTLGAFFGLEKACMLTRRVQDSLKSKNGYWCMDVRDVPSVKTERIVREIRNELGKVVFFAGQTPASSNRVVLAQQYYSLKAWYQLLSKHGFSVLWQTTSQEFLGTHVTMVVQL